jgi:hypothetical protein
MSRGILAKPRRIEETRYLTMGLPPILARYQDSEAKVPSVRVIVDREGMAVPFLRDLKSLGHTMVTVLRTDQYDGLESFTEVGMFVPLERDRQGQLVRKASSGLFRSPTAGPERPVPSFTSGSHS